MMEDVPDPLGPLDPLDDPMLDALERSIEQSPGPADPLGLDDAAFVDPVGRMLDALEADVQGPPLVPGSGMIDDGDEADAFDALPGDALELEAEALDVHVPGSAIPGDEPGQERPPVGVSGPRSLSGSQQVTRRRGDRGAGRGGRGSPPRYRPSGGSRRTTPRIWSPIRFCQDIKETVDEGACLKCDKYRHWPEGTPEEPRQCWYEWQLEADEEGRDAGDQKEDSGP